MTVWALRIGLGYVGYAIAVPVAAGIAILLLPAPTARSDDGAWGSLRGAQLCLPSGFLGDRRSAPVAGMSQAACHLVAGHVHWRQAMRRSGAMRRFPS